MQYKIFYSWQSDLPNNVNRHFINTAIKSAIKEFKKSDDYEIEPVLDRDTVGVTGTPDISKTIFDKIDKSDLFIADVSITERKEQRAFPNSNVLIEVGYAVKSLGWERIVLVFNTAYGEPEDLPFDLRSRRITSYCCSDSETEKAQPRKGLSKILIEAIKLGVKGTTASVSTSPSERVKEHDVTLFAEFKNILPTSGSIQFINDFNMAGWSFDDDKLDDIRNFYYQWIDPEHEFIDEQAENIRKELYAVVSEYYSVIATETFTTGTNGRRSVPSEWEEEQPERFRRVVNSLHDLAQKVVDKHKELMRYGIRKFAK